MKQIITCLVLFFSSILFNYAEAKTIYSKLSDLKEELSRLQIKFGREILLPKEKFIQTEDDEKKLTKKEKVLQDSLIRNSFYEKIVTIKNLFFYADKNSALIFRDKDDNRASYIYTNKQKLLIIKNILNNKGKKFTITGKFLKLGDAVEFEYLSSSIQH